MRRAGPVNVIVHFPTTTEGKEALACRVAEVHANAVTTRIRKLNCPNEQKLQLLDAVIRDAKTACQKRTTEKVLFS